MRAVLTLAHGDRSNLKLDANFPDPAAGEGEVVLKVAATAINFHDIFTRRGMPGIKIQFPIIVGSDIAGEIVDLGKGVVGWKRGDRVLVDPIYRDGKNIGMIGETTHGGRAEFVTAQASQLVTVPNEVSLEDAAALPLAYATAYRMLITHGKIKRDEKILILGASGGVGVACVQIAKLWGLEVTACASSASKMERLRRLGADHVINYTAQKFRTAVREIHGKPRIDGTGGVDVAVNFTGGDTWTDTQKCLRYQGRLLTCGATAGYEVKTDARYLWTFEHQMIGSNGWTSADLHDLLGLIRRGQFRPAIDKVLRLEDAAEGERLLEEREVVGKIILRP